MRPPFIALLLLISLAAAQTPLELLQPRIAPVQAVSLSGLSPSSAWAIADSNENLTAWKDRPLDDLGKYFSGVRWLDNGQAGVPKTLTNFTNTTDPLPKSIDTEAGNEGQAPVVAEDEGMVFP
jgi:hypothetical protein